MTALSIAFGLSLTLTSLAQTPEAMRAIKDDESSYQSEAYQRWWGRNSFGGLTTCRPAEAYRSRGFPIPVTITPTGRRDDSGNAQVRSGFSRRAGVGDCL